VSTPGEVRVASTGALSLRGHVLRPAVTPLRECGSRAVTDNSATPHTRKRLKRPAAYINIETCKSDNLRSTLQGVQLSP